MELESVLAHAYIIITVISNNVVKVDFILL